MAVAKKCIGCQSNKRHFNTIYYHCKENINLFRGCKLHHIFRDEFCPCVTCLVKATCVEPKVSKFRWAILYGEDDDHHKCKLMRSQIDKFSNHIKEHI
jgi:hypothetical protein